MTVRRLDPGRYLVRSQRIGSQSWYLVDFTERHFPHGRCDCPDFCIRIESYMNRGEQPEKLTCKHIQQVLAELAHAQVLCEIAGMPFSESIIPEFQDCRP